MCGSSSACLRELRPSSAGSSSSDSPAAAGEGAGHRKTESRRAEKESTSSRGVPAADHPRSLIRAAPRLRSLGTTALAATDESLLLVAADRALSSSCSAYSFSVLAATGLLAASGQASGDQCANRFFHEWTSGWSFFTPEGFRRLTEGDNLPVYILSSLPTTELCQNTIKDGLQPRIVQPQRAADMALTSTYCMCMCMQSRIAARLSFKAATPGPVDATAHWHPRQ